MLEQDAKKLDADRGQGGVLATSANESGTVLADWVDPCVRWRQGIFAAAKFLDFQKIGAWHRFSVAAADETEPRTATPQG